MAEFSYEITERIAVLSTSANGWERQLNLVSWNGREPKYDIRDWSPDGSKMGKGKRNKRYFRLHTWCRLVCASAGYLQAQP